jgi:hypothetical protein
MLKLESVGEVIATRELTLDETQKVTILIGKPQVLPNDKDWEDWRCPYQKLGLGHGHVKCGYGVDPVQALFQALQMIGAELYCSEEYEAGRLRWDCGATKGDLGFPVPENIRDVLPGGV